MLDFTTSKVKIPGTGGYIYYRFKAEYKNLICLLIEQYFPWPGSLGNTHILRVIQQEKQADQQTRLIENLKYVQYIYMYV